MAKKSIGENGIQWESGEGWDSLTRYYKEIRSAYSKSSKEKHSFSKWFEFEKIGIYSEDRENLDKQVQEAKLSFLNNLTKIQKY